MEKSSNILIGAGAIVGIAYLITKTKTQPSQCTADNDIKIHVDEYDKTDPNGDYDILTPSANTDIKITDASRNILNNLITNSDGNACLTYGNMYISGKWYIATSSKYGYESVEFSAMKEFKIPIKEINLILYRIYLPTEIIIGE